MRSTGYLVIELKAVKFEPGFLSQLGMYMAAVVNLLAHTYDKPTIGLLLCKSKNNLVAEYALRTTSMPIGVSEWKAEIVESLPEPKRFNPQSLCSICNRPWPRSHRPSRTIPLQRTTATTTTLSTDSG